MCELERSSEPPFGHISPQIRHTSASRIALHNGIGHKTHTWSPLHKCHSSSLCNPKGFSKWRSAVLFVLSIPEQRLGETEENVLYLCAVLAGHHLINSVSSVVPSQSLFPAPVYFSVWNCFSSPSWWEKRHNLFCDLNGRKESSPLNESNHQASSLWLFGA